MKNQQEQEQEYGIQKTNNIKNHLVCSCCIRFLFLLSIPIIVFVIHETCISSTFHLNHKDITQYNVSLFKTVAYMRNNSSKETDKWVVPIRGHVFEKYHDSFTMRWTSKYFAFQFLHWLLVVQSAFNDNLKKHIVHDWLRYSAGPSLSVNVSFQIDEFETKEFTLQTDSNGYIDGIVTFSCLEMEKMASRLLTQEYIDNWYPYQIVNNSAMGYVQLVATYIPEAEYMSVISDIDDTIKHTNVLNLKEMIYNTFFRDFESVPFMSHVYNHWHKEYSQRRSIQYERMQENGIQCGTNLTDQLLFHYVSSSPIQLHTRLVAFLESNNFPFHSVDLKRLSIIDSTIINLFKPSTKANHLERIITSHSYRKFILVGDSNEKDAFIYGNLMRKYMDRVKYIFIRCPCTGAFATGSTSKCCSRKDKKFIDSFYGLPEERWHVFSDARELLDIDIFKFI
jgi:phosphatidate phosphatase APP1